MTARLAHLAVEHWRTIDGYAVAHGMGDLRSLPLDRFCNYVWWFFTRNAEEKDVRKLETQLWRPPDPVMEIDPRSPWHPDNEKKAFDSLKGQLGMVPGR